MKIIEGDDDSDESGISAIHRVDNENDGGFNESSEEDDDYLIEDERVITNEHKDYID